MVSRKRRSKRARPAPAATPAPAPTNPEKPDLAPAWAAYGRLRAAAEQMEDAFSAMLANPAVRALCRSSPRLRDALIEFGWGETDCQLFDLTDAMAKAAAKYAAAE